MNDNHLLRLILNDQIARSFWLEKASALLADPDVKGELSPMTAALRTHIRQAGVEARNSLRKNTPEWLPGWDERVLYVEMFCSAIDSIIERQEFEVIASRLLDEASGKTS